MMASALGNEKAHVESRMNEMELSPLVSSQRAEDGAFGASRFSLLARDRGPQRGQAFVGGCRSGHQSLGGPRGELVAGGHRTGEELFLEQPSQHAQEQRKPRVRTID